MCFLVLTCGQPPANTASVANARHVHTRLIKNLRPLTLIKCNQAASHSRSTSAVRLVWPRNMHVKWLNGRTHASDGFARPKRVAEDRKPAIFQFADHTKSIARVGCLVRIQPAFGEVAFEFGVGLQRS